MTVFHASAVLLTLAALVSYLNHRFVRLPATIGLMVISLVATSLLVLAGYAGLIPGEAAARFIGAIDFGEVVLHAMLAFLLFAGALHVDLDDLRSNRFTVLLLATVGVVLATSVIGGLFWAAAAAMGMAIPFLYALLFGALISPTDPIAVLGIIRKVGAPRGLEIKIAGEALFNDGVGVVVFITILDVVLGRSEPGAVHISLFLLKEVAGGIFLGLALGWAVYRLLRSVDAYQVEILLTLALAAGGYSLAEKIHVSAPITVVVAGLLIGNHGRSFAMSEGTRGHLDTFWELVDEMLNAILFVLIGMELVVIRMSGASFALGLLAVAAVLAGRFLSVGAPMMLLRRFRDQGRGAVRILTWAGLRGGISIALALSLPPGRNRDVILAVTYCVVVFSVLVQGLTVGRVVRRFHGGPGERDGQA